MNSLYLFLFLHFMSQVIFSFFRPRPLGMVTVIANVVQQERVIGLWRGLVPVSSLKFLWITVKPVLSSHSKIDQTKVLKPCGSSILLTCIKP